MGAPKHACRLLFVAWPWQRDAAAWCHNSSCCSCRLLCCRRRRRPQCRPSCAASSASTRASRCACLPTSSCAGLHAMSSEGSDFFVKGVRSLRFQQCQSMWHCHETCGQTPRRAFATTKPRDAVLHLCTPGPSVRPSSGTERWAWSWAAHPRTTTSPSSSAPTSSGWRAGGPRPAAATHRLPHGRGSRPRPPDHRRPHTQTHTLGQGARSQPCVCH